MPSFEPAQNMSLCMRCGRPLPTAGFVCRACRPAALRPIRLHAYDHEQFAEVDELTDVEQIASLPTTPANLSLLLMQHVDAYLARGYILVDRGSEYAILQQKKSGAPAITPPRTEIHILIVDSRNTAIHIYKLI
ncbi:hypothetical protein EPA93_31945 [Ktedonosporobacter rubrisoli]|uniref:Uncharacterized protein n=1 Tax=Ktedonosporobacter rubrisoli TaxID=2509675 RepID=A0A4P6JZ24_KTERU|nr:hypothetical protein [Ktedonosporobacter rubrisoli]QBD80336.1 hypothetical protein EPA93_31945 [Ktedonosporobacter rubrisoli]